MRCGHYLAILALTVSLMALSISVGMLIDDAIVVRRSEEDRDDPEKILQLPVVMSRGTQLPLSTVAGAAGILRCDAPERDVLGRFVA